MNMVEKIWNRERPNPNLESLITFWYWKQAKASKMAEQVVMVLAEEIAKE